MRQNVTAESPTEHHPLDTVPEGVRGEATLSLRRSPQIGGRSSSTGDDRWVGHLRGVCRAQLRFWGLADLMDNAQLLVSELVTNALRHGDSQRVTCRLLFADDLVTIEVDDGSPGRRANLTTAGPEDESGRGMLIVATLASAWGVGPDGTKTWCTLAVPADPGRGRR
ncbi:ATP-binding protein [Streptomyces sp. NPDC059578]|uniref:ATP-binding protein n=1 Tax=unclassified Streptomyces TaxID=2593676 RepID=UPI00364805B9